MRPIRPKVPIVPTLHVQQIRLMKLIVPTRSIRPEMPIEQVHLVPIGVRLITVKDRKGQHKGPQRTPGDCGAFI